jgi:TolA-binding protein
MSADPLLAALSAYREEHTGAAVRVALVRRCVLAGASQKRERRAKLLRFMVPIAATFVASAALAATEPGRARVQQVIDRLELMLSHEPQRQTPPVRGTRAASDRRDAPPRTPEGSAPSPEQALPQVVTLDELPLVSPPASTVDDAAAVPPSTPPDSTGTLPSVPESPDPDLLAYQRAHVLHFRGAPPKAALAAWDAYLAAFPGGTFAPEARLNRAVCLARVGKARDAKSALTEIAGDEGAYGRARATPLLEALSPKARAKSR